MARIDDLVRVLGGGDPDGYFTASFDRAVPRDRFVALRDQLVAALGKPEAVTQVTPLSPAEAELVVRYARGQAIVRIAVEPARPDAARARVSGLLVTATAPPGADSFSRISTEIAALPGTPSFAVFALGGAAPRLIAGTAPDRPVPLGSAFKLWVLGEAARQVAAGTRRWADVVAAGAPSLGGTLATWPAGSPVTLHTLATLMISASDNSATDTLMATLGRAAVDRAATADAGAAAAPVPTTRELLLVKADPALAATWAIGDPAARARLLADRARTFAAAPIDANIFAGGQPLRIDTVEWFASPAQLARTLDRLHRAGEATRAILAIEPGVDATTAARFAYLGYKGGSEPGVMTMAFLAQTRRGDWYAVVGACHRSDAPIDPSRLVVLMTRLLTLVAAR